MLSTIGVLIGLMVMGQPFGVVMTGIGVIANAGVIVNNNIVLIDTYDRLRREGVAAYDAIIETCRERARPVVLTAVTAILGVLPIAFGMNIEFMTREITIGAPATQWWISLSTAIVFGLGFATVLTLIVTPAALMAIANVAAWRERRRARRAERARRALRRCSRRNKTGRMPLDPTPLVSKTPVIPVLTIERAADAVPLARALVAGGLPVIEVTLRTKAALDAIKAIAGEVPDCIVGVGTVTRVADIAAAISAGAKYLVSPGTPPELAAALADAAVPVLPGCATVSEAMALVGARLQGAEVLPRRSLRRHRVAEIGRGAAARHQVLPDRRDRREKHRGLSRLPERARGRRLVGRAEGCDRGRRFCAHHAACARGVRAARRRMSRPARKRRAFDWSAAVIAALAIGSAIFVFFRDGQARFLAILTEDLGLFGTMLPKVLAGCLIGAFVTLLLPRETIARWVGAESGIGGILVATVAGAILPGGPFTIYPVAAAFLAAGADAGAACAFVISWTLIGYTRAIVWELPFFGLDFVTWRIIFSLPLPILAGLAARYAWRFMKPAAP